VIGGMWYHILLEKSPSTEAKNMRINIGTTIFLKDKCKIDVSNFHIFQDAISIQLIALCENDWENDWNILEPSPTMSGCEGNM